ncbi:hypothetical protein CGH44_08730 [Vibrio parahaemolyticus]|nr:hypothetical protein CGI82_20665 [Vibrio parahaemolyticus]TOO10638.1 hypothetical protein CGH44_08730 [Vibrio parahaemolyticus]
MARVKLLIFGVSRLIAYLLAVFDLFTIKNRPYALTFPTSMAAKWQVCINFERLNVCVNKCDEYLVRLAILASRLSGN